MKAAKNAVIFLKEYIIGDTIYKIQLQLHENTDHWPVPFCGFMLAASFVLMDASAGETYQDTSLSPAQRADLLIKEMTLEEKIGQMCQYVGPGHIKQNEQKADQNSSDMGNIDADAFGLKSQVIIDKVRKGEIGSFEGQNQKRRICHYHGRFFLG